jgi:outer membrane protein insertion porin family
MTFAPVAFGTEFKDSLVRALLDKSVRPMYEAHGFVRVAFTKIAAEKSTEPGVDAVAVTVTIEEGPEFKLGRIRYAPGIPGGDARELDRIAGLRTGEIANFDDVSKAQDRIVRKYRGMGYLHASVKQDRTLDDEARTVDLLLTVDPGPRFAYGKLTIDGLDIISEPAIRKMWGDREGSPFDADFPDVFLKDVRDQGFFDNLGKTSSATRINEEARTVDVTLTFEGAKGNNGKERPLRQPF